MSYAARAFEDLLAAQPDPADMPVGFLPLRDRLAAQGCQVAYVPPAPHAAPHWRVGGFALCWRRGPARGRACYASLTNLTALEQFAVRLESGDR